MLIPPTINSFRGSPFITSSQGMSGASETCASIVSRSDIGEKTDLSNLDQLLLELPIRIKSADTSRNVK